MRYQRKSATAYIFRNFWQLAPFAVIAAVLLGFFCNTNAEVILIEGCISGTVTNENVLSSVLRSVSIMRFGTYWWGTLLALVAFAFAESLLTAKVYNHMRTGEMLTFPMRKTVGVAPTMFLFVFAMALINEIFKLIVCGIVALLRPVGVTAIVVVALCLVFIIKTAMLSIIATLLYAFPIMFLENYKFNQALSYSVRIAGEQHRIIWLVSVGYPVVQVLITVACFFVKSQAFTIAMFSLFYLACILLVPCIAFTLYYDSVGGERHDVGKKIF